MKSIPHNTQPSLEKLRTQIDVIDNDIVQLLAKRFAVTHKVGVLKNQNKVASIDPQREAQQRKKMTALATAAGISPKLCHDIQRLIIDEVVLEHEAIKQQANVEIAKPATSKPTVGIIGLGSFGQLAVQALSPYCELRCYDNSPSANSTVTITPLAEVLRSSFIILAVPLSAYPTLLTTIAPIIDPDTTLIDICSVKMRPQELFTKYLPKHTNVVFTHPLFGPQSASNGVAGNTIIITNPKHQSAKKVHTFCKDTLGLTVRTMTENKHDELMADLHALTFFVARGLNITGLKQHEYQIPSFQMLLDLIALDNNHSQDLFLTIEQGNPFAKKARAKLLRALQTVEKEIE